MPRHQKAKVKQTQVAKEGEYWVTEVVDKRYVEGGKVEYLVRWEGCSEQTWEPASSSLKGCRNLISSFEKKRKKALSSPEIPSVVPPVCVSPSENPPVLQPRSSSNLTFLTCPIPGCTRTRSTISNLRIHLSKEHKKGTLPSKDWLTAIGSKLFLKCSQLSQHKLLFVVVANPNSIPSRFPRRPLALPWTSNY